MKGKAYRDFVLLSIVPFISYWSKKKKLRERKGNYLIGRTIAISQFDLYKDKRIHLLSIINPGR